jgi:hypothetical protein
MRLMGTPVSKVFMTSLFWGLDRWVRTLRPAPMFRPCLTALAANRARQHITDNPGRNEMLQIRDHGVADYTELLDMDATDVGVLGEDDRACLAEVGAYVVSTAAWQRFAVWLLHSHLSPPMVRSSSNVRPAGAGSKPRWSHGQNCRRSR